MFQLQSLKMEIQIGLRRVCTDKVCERTSRYHQRGDVSSHDCTMDAALYCGYMKQIIEGLVYYSKMIQKMRMIQTIQMMISRGDNNYTAGLRKRGGEVQSHIVREDFTAARDLLHQYEH